MDNCVFCQIVAKKSPAYIVYEDPDYLAFLDKYPQTRGHLQLIPKAHFRWVWEIPDMGSFFAVAGKIIRAIIPVLNADHVTMATLGQEVYHAHLWIVPQYRREVILQEGFRSGTREEDKAEVAKLLRSALVYPP